MPVNGPALAMMGTGALFLWSGIHGTGMLHAIQDIVSGHHPSATVTNPISGGGGNGGGGSVSLPDSSNAIAVDALTYKGTGYVWGGDGSTRDDKDCSSFVSLVLSHDLGIPIPGYPNGDFGGKGHGPNVAIYRVWSGAVTIPLKEAQPGDLICFGVNSHIGIAVGNGKMISAENSSLGTQVTVIADQHESFVTCRRVRLNVGNPQTGTKPRG